MISVKVLSIGSPLTSLVLQDSSRVRDALYLLQIPDNRYSEVSLSVNGNAATLDSQLKEGDILIYVFPIRGEACAKVAGDIWLVHQYDPDDIFPSNFHAHNHVRPETLDLHTGNVFNAVTRQFSRKLGRKHLQQVRKQLPARLLRTRFA